MTTVKVCPKCGSENVKVDPQNVKASAGLAPASYICLDCGHSGMLFPEIDKKAPAETDASANNKDDKVTKVK